MDERDEGPYIHDYNKTVFPSVEPYATMMLDVGDGHTLYVEESGNPKGIPVVYLHGGPGYWAAPESRRFFSPERYRIILFDQRGCGRSTPKGSIHANTTWHLVEDMEKIRTKLGIGRWIVFGGSWGTTLALVYAIKHPNQVAGLILRGIFLGTREEINAFYQDGWPRYLYPSEWAAYQGFIPKEEQDDLLRAYYRRLLSSDETARRAAEIFAGWEEVCSSLEPMKNVLTDPDIALTIARIESHYFVSDCFLDHDHIVKNTKKIAEIPTYIVQGRQDLVCPPVNALRLLRAFRTRRASWSSPRYEFHLVDGAGHSSGEPKIEAKLKEATARMLDWYDRGFVTL